MKLITWYLDDGEYVATVPGEDGVPVEVDRLPARSEAGGPGSLRDAVEALTVPVWEPGIAVEVGEQYRYEGVTYEVVQAHTTQADWTPDVVPAMFTPAG